MKIVVQVLLVPDAGQAPALASTLPAVNDAANLASAVAFDRRVFREYALPATSPPAARLPGMRGVSHAPLPLPATGKGWTQQPSSPPVMP